MISASILSVTLLILKIIGLVLGGIVALALLIVFLILFDPVRVKVRAKFDLGSDKKELGGFVRGSWLLHIFQYTILSDGESYYKIFRIFGIPVKKETFSFGDKEPRSSASIPKDIADEIEFTLSNDDEDEDEGHIDFEPQVSKVYTEDAEIIDILNVEKSSSEILDDIYEEIEEDKARKSASNNSQDNLNKEDDSKLKAFRRKLKNILQGIKGLFSKLLSIPRILADAIGKARDGVQSGIDKLNEIEDFINDEKNIEAFNLVKKEGQYLVKHYWPSRMKGHVTFGVGDPAWTGRLLGICCIIFPINQKKFSINPDFEKTCLNGEIVASGHIRLVHLLASFIRLKSNKRLNELIKKYKK